MKTKILLMLVAVTSFLFGMIIMEARPDKVAERHIAEQGEALDRIPTIEEIQHKIGAEEDGIVGPNTISLWKRAINNQYAVESIERMAGDKK